MLCLRDQLGKIPASHCHYWVTSGDEIDDVDDADWSISAGRLRKTEPRPFFSLSSILFHSLPFSPSFTSLFLISATTAENGVAAKVTAETIPIGSRVTAGRMAEKERGRDETGRKGERENKRRKEEEEEGKNGATLDRARKMGRREKWKRKKETLERKWRPARTQTRQHVGSRSRFQPFSLFKDFGMRFSFLFFFLSFFFVVVCVCVSKIFESMKIRGARGFTCH